MLNQQSPSRGSQRSSLQIAGNLTPSDKQILRDYANTLKQQGGAAAQKELDRLNKMYAPYGMSFGTLKGV